MPMFRVKYFYLATGMEGLADERDYGTFEAEDAKAAVEKALAHKHPKDKMYGPKNSYSTNDFIRGCLSATLV